MGRQEELAGVKAGDVLANKYRVDRVLGVGGMGVVVAAHHLQLDDRVAIKFLLPDTLSNQEAVGRFAREARAAVKIKSEHVARVTDVGTLENGAPYMVMEYLEGVDLSGWVAERGVLPVERAVDFMLQACEAIAEAHALGIVHRDLKPANLFVARLPGGVDSVKVLDFGISKLTGLSASGGESSQTKTSALMGSPLYMSPEQMQSSKSVDSRGDIWALGVILYEVLTGAAPFVADTMPELVLSIMSSTPPTLRSHRPELPEGLDAVISRCLEKDRNKRIQTVGELAHALLPFGSKKARNSVDRISQVMQAAGIPMKALSEPPPSTAITAPSIATSSAFGTTTPPVVGRAKPALVAVATAVVLLGVGAVVLRSVRPAAEAVPSAEPPSAAGLPAKSAELEKEPAIATPASAAEVAPSTVPAPVVSAVGAAAPAEPSAAAHAAAHAAVRSPVAPKKAPNVAPAAHTAAPAAATPSVKKPSVGSLIDDRR
jgi:eukaryotic-like serine/threonine-protein kinase